MANSYVCILVFLAFSSNFYALAARSRVTSAVDARRMRVVAGNRHRLATADNDIGPVEPAMRLDHVVLMLKSSAQQQSELDQLLLDQQNPSSPSFRHWLTPEEFADRFGLTGADHSKVAAWLSSEGLTVQESARGRNWIAFAGTAAQVGNSLHTAFHRYRIAGATHVANSSDPSVPEALSDVVAGFLGLDDFVPFSNARLVPQYNSGASHYLVPEDFSTIYNIKPLAQAGIDGSGQSIGIIGQSDVLLTDLRSFRTRYGLPAADPTLIAYGTDPGFNGAQAEANLDLEWAGAIAPKASLFYYYGPNAFTALITAVNQNAVKVLSSSFGDCEINLAPSYYRSVAQQANAQGITVLSASGDAGAAACDSQGSQPLASLGPTVLFPAVLPEVTAVGGTQFIEGNGVYWAAANDTVFGSALSYIPEAAWNENATSGLFATGGGASQLYPKPAWQTGPGVPSDDVRHIPDIALSAAGHDAYIVTYNGNTVAIYGTSASTPSMAGIVALLNQYQISHKFQAQPGLGNINPQLYRLAQSVPSAFHDITAGNNFVPCVQGSVGCLTGFFGSDTGQGYDMATGLGSIDANNLVTQWNTATNNAAVSLTLSATRATVNDIVQLTATVTPATGTGDPTGSVDFSAGTVALGSVPLNGGSASLSFPLYQLQGTGTFTLSAVYSGDAAFGSRGSTARLQITAPTAAAGIVVSAPPVVWPQPADAQGLSWQTTLTLREVAGIPALITGFSIDGKPQPLAQYFPSPNVPASSSVTAIVIFRGLTSPVNRTFTFIGVDSAGNSWSRQLSVTYFSIPDYEYFNLTATPLTVSQNTAADPSCQWPVQLNVDDQGGGLLAVVNHLYAGGINLTSQIPAIFGSTRLNPLGGLQGTVCFGNLTAPSSNVIEIVLSSGATQDVTVAFAGPPAKPAKLTAAPAALTLASAPATVAVNLSDSTQTWTAAVFPANRTTAWLNLSRITGTGSGQINLTTSGAGFQPGVYHATIVLQCSGAIPQVVNVPVMYVLGGSSSGTSIVGVADPASGQTTGSPGMILSVFGSGLAEAPLASTASPLTYSLAGVSATVNGAAAPLLYVSPSQINIQIPYAVSAGPATLGINNNGRIAGFAFQVAPASPGIYKTITAPPGGNVTLYVNGIGEISPNTKTGYFTAATTAPASAPRPVLPVSVTVGGIPAFIQYEGISAGLIGTMQMNLVVPASVSPGPQPVVITVGGFSSQPVTLAVLPSP